MVRDERRCLEFQARVGRLSVGIRSEIVRIVEAKLITRRMNFSSLTNTTINII